MVCQIVVTVSHFHPCMIFYEWRNKLERTSIYLFGPFVNYNHKKFQYIRHRAGSNVSFVKFGVTEAYVPFSKGNDNALW
jgi:hypothetical protein